jgi:RimJ/RimL family protein N-acetyltransferase
MSIAPKPGYEIPTLESERLRLRAHRESDFDNCRSLWADPVVVRYTTKKPQSSEEVWWRMLRYAGHWTMLGYGYWVIEDKLTGEFIGEIGFADFRRTIKPPVTVPEAGWVLKTGSHGKGYATEAVRTIIAWADLHLEGDKTACIISPENTASVRVAEKCGYQHTATANYHDSPILVFERRRP